ncbi:MAG TPA: hypothetical protein VKC51_03975 [Lacunisphaera sp.]|nr:hypothetical protein [Lacunisphaera sp.]
MKRLPRPFLSLAAGLWLAAAPLSAADALPAGAAAPGKASRITDRIDALFRQRLRPVPLPVDLPNPFLVVSSATSRRPDDAGPGGNEATVVATNRAKSADEVQPGTDAETLARYAAKLKIGGTIVVSGVTQLVVNQSPYKEGDYIFLDSKEALMYVQIIRLTSSELTLGFKEAKQVIRLKNPAKPKDAEP